MSENPRDKFILEVLSSLEKLQQLHEQIRNSNISLLKLYPVTLVRDKTFFVFDLNKSSERYEYKLDSPIPMPIPENVLASFPLDFYHGRPSAIISDAAFDSLEGYICIFHEFVHCFQWENGEREIRATLEIERKYRDENNYMWELNHPFPYEDPFFVNKTIELEDYLVQGDISSIFSYHRKMKRGLNKIDYEYMIWQEWKEGFARYIENLIRNRFGIKPTVTKLRPNLDRVIFYEIGGNYIDLLTRNTPDLANDIRELYFKMYNV